MTADLLPVPRRGTVTRRWWNRRAVAIGILPMFTALMCVATLYITEWARLGITPWSEVASALIVAQVIVGALGMVALFDRRTRISGAVTLLLVVLFNPLSVEITLQLLGITS